MGYLENHPLIVIGVVGIPLSSIFVKFPGA